MRAPNRVRQFFARVLKKVQHYRSDVVARDANAAAYKYYKRQEYQDLYNSSVAVMLREMQREVNMNRPCQSRLHIDYSTNNHHSQLRSTDSLIVASWLFSVAENCLDPEVRENSGAPRVSVRRVNRGNKVRGQLLFQEY